MSQMIIYKILTNNINQKHNATYINLAMPMLDTIIYAHHSGHIGVEASHIKQKLTQKYALGIIVLQSWLFHDLTAPTKIFLCNSNI